MRGEDLDRDRTEALRMIAPQRAIESRNIEAYWDRLSDDSRATPPARLHEAEALWDGTAVLVLPNGSRWIHVKALIRHDRRGGNRYIQRLLQLLRAHMAQRRHIGPTGGLTDFSLDAESLDLRHVFCHECTRCLNLQDDAAEEDFADGRAPR